MDWSTHLQIETTVERLLEVDVELHDIVEFMAETSITYDELVSLREPWTRTVIGGRLDVFGWDGPRSVQMTQPRVVAAHHACDPGLASPGRHPFALARGARAVGAAHSIRGVRGVACDCTRSRSQRSCVRR